MVHSALPPQPPALIQAFTLDWAALTKANPGFRGPWEGPSGPPQLPLEFVPVLPVPKPAYLRVGVSRRRYWVGPVSDFAMYLGYAVLGGNAHYSPCSWWAAESFPHVDVDLGLSAPVFQPVFHPRAHPWELPPVQVWILDSPQTPQGPK